jgi:DNA-binding MarR family transcriptional regulator
MQHLALAGRLTPSVLGNMLRLTSGGTTAMVQRLERAGHVEREPHPVDGRSTLLRLTAKAEQDAIEAFAPLVADLDALADALPEDERALVGRFLDGIADAAERHADAAVRAAEDHARATIGAPVPALWA